MSLLHSSLSFRSALLVVGALAVFPATVTGANDLQFKGMAYPTWWHDHYCHPNSSAALVELASACVSHVSLHPTWYQDTYTSTNIAPIANKSASDTCLVEAISIAHALGISVMLKPHADLWSDPTHWRGQIGNGFTSEDQWQAWFVSYADFIAHYARLAESNSVEVFCVGTELVGTVHRETEWRSLISAVRSNYSGGLVYASNHGNESNVGWWDALEYIGVDAYYPLTGQNDPTLAQLIAAWTPKLNALEFLSTAENRPVVFTEIGYRSVDGVNTMPWDFTLDPPLDLQEQWDCYEAILQSVQSRPWFAGMFWWNWNFDPTERGVLDKSFTPAGKPAMQSLATFYGPGCVTPVYPDMGAAQMLYDDAIGTGWVNASWGSTIDWGSTNQPYEGSACISATIPQWSALALSHATGYATDDYRWLEFQYRPTAGPDDLLANLYFGSGETIGLRLNQTLYVQPLGNQWKRVRVPFDELGVFGDTFYRIEIKNADPATATLDIDLIRLPWGVEESVLLDLEKVSAVPPLEASWYGHRSIRYILEATTNWQTWGQLATPIDGGDAQIQHPVTPGASSAEALRLRTLQGPIDTLP